MEVSTGGGLLYNPTKGRQGRGAAMGVFYEIRRGLNYYAGMT